MWGRTFIPRTVYQVLYPFKQHFHCVGVIASLP